MKKLLFSLLFVWMVGVATAQTDRHGSPRPAVWRSSATTTADTNVFIASDTIHFHGVTISSPAANSWIEIYNASTATTLTTPFTRIDLTNNANPDRQYDVLFSSGLSYEKFGNAAITILWDWLITPTVGRENVGK